MNDWTKEWPTEPGWYWLYGWWSPNTANQPRLMAVRVRLISDGKPVYIADGNFFAREGGGWWRRMDVPELPAP